MNKHDRELKDLLQSIREGLTGPGLCTIADRQYKRLFAPRKRTERERASVKAKGEKRQGRREKVAAIRSEVMARACDGGAPRCESIDPESQRRCIGDAMVLDHWLGGRGRRRQQESAATCWALCLLCDHDRTHNRPSADFWNASFALHAKRIGVPFTPHYDARAACRATRAKETRNG